PSPSPLTASHRRQYTNRRLTMLKQSSTEAVLPDPVSPNFNPSKKLRILLLSPRGPLYRHRGGIWKKSMRYAPLTLTTLASLVPEEINAEIRAIDEGIDQIEPDKLDADLVGISAITGTSPRSSESATSRLCWAAFIRRSCPTRLSRRPTPSSSVTPKNPGHSCSAIS